MAEPRKERRQRLAERAEEETAEGARRSAAAGRPEGAGRLAAAGVNVGNYPLLPSGLTPPPRSPRLRAYLTVAQVPDRRRSLCYLRLIILPGLELQKHSA